MSRKKFLWDQEQADPIALCHGESVLANSALRDYAMMAYPEGTEGLKPGSLRKTRRRSLRILLASYQDRLRLGQTAPTDSWSTLSSWSKNFLWVERSQAFDLLLQEKILDAFIDLQIKEKDLRIKTLTAYRSKLLQALQQIDPAAATWAEITAGIKMVTEEMRRELGEEKLAVDLSVAPGQRNDLEKRTDEELEQMKRNLLLAFGKPGGDGDGPA